MKALLELGHAGRCADSIGRVVSRCALRPRNTRFGLQLLVAASAFPSLTLGPAAHAAERVFVDNKESSGAPSPVVGQWMAAGSGCKGTSKEKGNVALERAAWSGSDKKSFVVQFAAQGYRLRPLDKADKGAEPSLVSYARECALRFSVNPPKGTRLAAVTARADTEVSKDAASELLVNAVLKVGSASVAEERRQFDKSQVFNHRGEIFELIPGRSPELEMPPLACEETKVVGADFTFLTHKDKASSQAEARLAGDEKVRFELAFVPCAPTSK